MKTAKTETNSGKDFDSIVYVEERRFMGRGWTEDRKA